MCDNNVGVAKRIDIERVSTELADFVKKLEKQVEVNIKVGEIKKFQTKLEDIIKR